jgi:hypothetical protein
LVDEQRTKTPKEGKNKTLRIHVSLDNADTVIEGSPLKHKWRVPRPNRAAVKSLFFQENSTSHPLQNFTRAGRTAVNQELTLAYNTLKQISAHILPEPQLRNASPTL